MIAGTRQKTIGGTAYRNDPLYAFGKAFTEAANDILTVENFDLFAEPSRAIRSTGAKEALKEFFCNNFVDDNNTYLSAEELEDLHEDVENMFENDINAIQENAYMSQYAPMVGMALPIHKLILIIFISPGNKNALHVLHNHSCCLINRKLQLLRVKRLFKVVHNIQLYGSFQILLI